MVSMRKPGPVGIGVGHGVSGVSVAPGPAGTKRQETGVQRLGPTGVFPAPGAAVRGKKPKMQYFLDRARRALERASLERRAKKFKMPEPATDVAGNMTVMIHEIDWPLFHGRGDKARPEDVVQKGATNCALASILAALAHTPKGRTRIGNMIKEYKHPTLTTYSGDHFHTFNGDHKALGARYFTVTFPGAEASTVSSVFFTDEQTSPAMSYMDSRKPKVLWACVLEKAYAAIVGGYDEFSQDPVKVWKDVVGAKPKFLSMQPGTQNFAKNDKEVLRQAKKADREPMIAAIVGKEHGEAVKGVDGSHVTLYDPFKAKPEMVSAAHLRAKKTVFYYQAL